MSDVMDYEPIEALDGGEDGKTALQALLRHFPRFIKR